MSNKPRDHPRWQFAVRGRTLFVLPEIDDDDDPARKDALAIRNACNLTGRCPSCGCTVELEPDADESGLIHGYFRHEDGCPVLTTEATS